MRVDLRRCDRCKGEYDALAVDRSEDTFDLRPFYGGPDVDLCEPCLKGVSLYVNNQWNVVPPLNDVEPMPGELIPTPGTGRALWANAVPDDVKWAYNKLEEHSRVLEEHHIKLELCGHGLLNLLTATPFIP